MRPKIFKEPIKLFKRQFLTRLTYVLCDSSVIEYSYQNFKLDNFILGVIRSNCVNLREIICSYGAKNYEKLKQHVYTAVSDAFYLCFAQN
jgi:hypothetical protein